MKVIDLKLLLNDEMQKSVASSKQDTGRYIAMAYRRVLKILTDKLIDQENVTQAKILSLDLTNHMKKKLIDLSRVKLPEYIKKRKLMDKLKLELTNILGIGAKKADALMASGLTKISDLNKPKWKSMLTEESVLMLEHKPERKIPHDVIKHMQPILEDKGGIIVGSFRRKKPYSRDIDVLLRGKSPKDLDTYLKHISGHYKIWQYAYGNDRASMLIAYGKKKYKLDVFRTPPESFYTQLLYSTGSKDFNVRMRSRAKRMGFLLNQKGLYKIENGVSSIKVNKPSDDEKKIFAYLSMEYIAPHLRK